jgi:hypothetical protein
MSNFSVSFKNLKSSIPKVLRLLYESGVEFECNWNEEFIKELDNCNSELNTVWLKKIGLANSVVIKEGDVFRKPTSHFKEYCGDEWLNKKGTMTTEEAIYFLNYNIKLRKMKEKDGCIFINEWMQGLLKEYRSVIYREELPLLVDRLFIDDT